MTDLSPRPTNDVAPGSPRRRRKWLPIALIGLVLVVGGILVTQFLRSAVDYFCNVDEIGHRSGCEADRSLRVQGIVAFGSVDASAAVTTFTMRWNGVDLPVEYGGEPGGIFKECIPVVVHGKFDGADGVFMADNLEVKHTNEYMAANGDRVAEADQLAEQCAAGD